MTHIGGTAFIFIRGTRNPSVRTRRRIWEKDLAGLAGGSGVLCTVNVQERVITLTVAPQVCVVGGVYMLAVLLACLRRTDGLGKRGIAMT